MSRSASKPRWYIAMALFVIGLVVAAPLAPAWSAMSLGDEANDTVEAAPHPPGGPADMDEPVAPVFWHPPAPVSRLQLPEPPLRLDRFVSQADTQSGHPQRVERPPRATR